MLARWSYLLPFLLIAVVAVAVSQSDGAGISIGEYAARRARVMERLDSTSIAVFRANDTDHRNGDVNFRYRQNSNFLYLTGCSEWGATLLLVPAGIQIEGKGLVRELFFVTGGRSNWTGDRLGIEGAERILGFGPPGSARAAFAHVEFADLLARAMQGKKTLYYTPVLPEVIFDPVSGKKFVSSKEIKNELKTKYPDVEVKNTGSLVGDLRGIKSAAEMSLLQRAIDATADAHVEAMKSIEPGMNEFEVQATVEYCFARAGAEYTGFPSIIGSGPNALILHYEENRRTMADGDVVVMDIGAEYAGYSADITRTVPVNGEFSDAQQELYEIVLAANDAATKEMIVGAASGTPSKKAFEVLAQGLIDLGIIKEKSEVSTYCPHGVSHPIGLDVHDAGRVGADLKEGMVLTIEPGLYVPVGSKCDKKYWNIGIRIEDDVLVTADGPKVLSARAPRTIDEIEDVMEKHGVGNQPLGKQ